MSSENLSPRVHAAYVDNARVSCLCNFSWFCSPVEQLSRGSLGMAKGGGGGGGREGKQE